MPDGIALDIARMVENDVLKYGITKETFQEYTEQAKRFYREYLKPKEEESER